MSVCPICHHPSRDPTHCELCDAALSPDAGLPPAIRLPDGADLDLSAFDGRWPSDYTRAAVLCHGDGFVRVHALERGGFRDLAPGLRERAALDLPALPPVRVVPCGEGALVLADATIDGPALPPLADDANEWALLEHTAAAVAEVAAVMSALHAAGLLWLMFAPDAVERTARGLRIINLDLGVSRPGAFPGGVRPSAAFTAPEVVAFQRERIGPEADVFSLAAFAYYRLARLPDRLPGDGLSAFDFAVPPLRTYRPWLPAGVAPVVERALRRDPKHRPPSPTAFAEDLSRAVRDAHARQDAAVSVVVEAAGASVPGRVHISTGMPNQDRFAIVPVPGGEAYVVADGVTHALIGSGDVASQTAVERFEQTLPGIGAGELMERAKALARAFEDASAAVLDRALAEPLGRFATDPTDLMSTTAVIAVRHGRELLIGSAGDSRTYLVRGGVAEQLTVDGDVGSLHLAAGVPPEQVHELGSMALSLYRCLGVSHPGPGGLVLDPERCQPDLSFWPLLPGDVIVLCTDGLVEEGVFLSPDDLAGLIDDAPVGVLVERLVAAAVDRHRDPSMEEPDGCGDDVTCVVVRVLPADGPRLE